MINITDEILHEILPQVRKPARYIGSEWNAVKKDHSLMQASVALCFPDIYEIGMSHIGLKILYSLLNEIPDVVCERVFAPWVDMEDILRSRGIGLFSLETRKPISSFDILGFSLQSEFTYTNVLNILDLAGIPLRSKERKGFPIIIGGGPCCYNPEPISDFFDLFVIGEAEDVIVDIMKLYKSIKYESGQFEAESKNKFLREASKLKGIYVPSFYEAKYKEDGKIESILPLYPDIPSVIKKAIVLDLDGAHYPTKPIVPYIEVIHDRLTIEIMRGCYRGCNFCQAHSTYKPVRHRSVGKILEIIRESLPNTGYDEIGLVSLSSADHPGIVELAEQLNIEYAGQGVGISISSLRIDKTLQLLPKLIVKNRKTGLTIALEAGSERLRGVINKNIDIDKFKEGVSAAYKEGWRRIKLYFMIGLPTETYSDLDEMISLVNYTSELRREAAGSPADVSMSIASFIPKPHTFFQYEDMDDMDTLINKIDYIRSKIGRRHVEFKFHDPKMSVLEGMLSRGGRKLCDCVYLAWKKGAKFDAWSEHFKFDIWMEAFSEKGIEPRSCTKARYNKEDALPWSHIKV